MSKIKTAISLLKTPSKMVLPMADNGLFNWMPDKLYLQFVFHCQTGRKLDLDNPQTYNEKLQWLKLYDRNPAYRKMVDKYEVKQYVSSLIGQQYIVPTIGIWTDPDDIEFSGLPSQFVLKCTHDSGSIIICKDKGQFDVEKAKHFLRQHMKKSIYWFGREWPYKDLVPRIIAEPYLSDESGIELKDYKVHTFNGIPRLIQVDYGRFTTSHKRNIYSCEWKYMDVAIKYPSDSKTKIVRPEKLDEMLEIAKILSKDIPHVRVDFYSIFDKLYFGELTFFHGSGFETIIPETFAYEMGSWLSLPQKKNS